MAEEKKEIIIDVKIDTEKAQKSLSLAMSKVASLKESQAALRKEIEAGNDKTGELAATYAEYGKQLEQAQREVKSNTAALQLSNAVVIEGTESLDEQRQALNAAQKAYAQLSGDAKKLADQEGGLRDQINALSDSVKAQEAAIGDARRNVGNYEGSILSAADKAHLLADSFKATAAGSTVLGKGVDSVDKTMKVMSKNPLMGIVVALAPLLSKIIGLVTENKSVMDALNKVMKPLGDALKWIADLIGNVLVGALKALESAWNAVAGFFGSIVSWFTGTSEAEDEAAKAAEEYAKQVENLTAQLEKEQKALAQLQKDNKYHLELLKARGATERQLFLQRAQDQKEELELQKQIYQNAEDAFQAYQQQLKALNGLNEKGNIIMSEEEKQKWEDMKAARSEAYATLTEMDRAYKVMAVQYATDEAKERERIEKESAEKRKAERQRQYEEERAAWVQRITDLELLAEAEAATLAAKEAEIRERAKAMLDALNEDEEEDEGEKKILPPAEQARQFFGLDEEGVQYFLELLDEGVSITEAKTKAITEQTRRMTQAWATLFGDLGGSFEKMGDALGEFANESEDAAKAQKAFAFSGIMLNQAQSISEGALAIAKGVESASAIPFPANIPAIISIVAQISGMIAGVMSSIAQAKQVFAQADTSAQKFSHGGIVEGTSYTGDKVPTWQNSREMDLTLEQQGRLFDAINGQGDGSLGVNYELMAAAMSQVKIYADYTEMKSFEQNIINFDEIASV